MEDFESRTTMETAKIELELSLYSWREVLEAIYEDVRDTGHCGCETCEEEVRRIERAVRKIKEVLC